VTDGIQIRAAMPGDEPALLDLWRRAEAEPSATDDIGSIGRLIDEQPGGVLVAEVDGVIVGSLLALWDGWRGNLYRLAVDPKHRRHGLGSKLLEVGEQSLRQRGCRRISALVMHDHDDAVGFWRATSLDPDDRVVRYVRTLED